jgi:signal transduction histidine kinase
MNQAPELLLSGAGPSVDGSPDDLTACLAAFAEITTALLLSPPEEALDLVVRQARRLTSATVACIEALSAPDALLVEAFDGPGGEWGPGRVRPLEEAAPYRELLNTGQAVIVAEAAQNQPMAAPGFLGGLPLGPVLLLPLAGGPRPLGALTIGGSPGRSPFTPVERAVATLLAGHAALALERSRRRDQPGPGAPDPERIAQDLHDVVMQRLFATGLQLQGLAPAVVGPVSATLTAATGSLDQAMADVRAAILALRRIGTAEAGLREALLHATARAERHDTP